MNCVDSLLNIIKLGREGLNQGIPMKMPKLESLIDGVTKETNTLVFSNSGSGKTSLALYAYIYQPLSQHLDDDKFYVIYFSLEMSKEVLLAKLLATHIYFHYGIRIGVKEILSRKKNYILGDDIYDIVLDSKDWLEKISKHLFIYDRSATAEFVYNATIKELKKFGSFSDSGNYTQNDPECTILGVVDHVGLLTPKGKSLKEEIDLLSKGAVYIRNKTKMSWLFIQQANRDQANIERFKQGKSAFTINDTKDSGNIVQDSEIVLAIYNPYKDGLKTYHKYDVAAMDGYFRSIMCLKNRYGESDREIGCFFDGKDNVWTELPKPEEIVDYSIYFNNKKSDKQEIKDNNDNMNNKHKFTF